jgi:transcriptional regulator with XRE-family HTH domain
MKEFDIKVMFGLRLRQLRKEKGLSQEQLMMSTGIHRTYLSEVERGIRNISIVNIYKISSMLDIDIMEMFNFKKINQESV